MSLKRRIRSRQDRQFIGPFALAHFFNIREAFLAKTECRRLLTKQLGKALGETSCHHFDVLASSPVLNSDSMSVLSDSHARKFFAWLAPSVLLLLASCIHPVTMHSKSGERLDGRWRFAREGSGLMQVFATDGEVLVGTFRPVSRGDFFANYQKMFGAGTIDADGPELSAYGRGFWAILGSSNALVDVAYGENYNSAVSKSPQVVTGPLFYWTANLQGDKRSVMQCFLIGSAYTGHGFGRCKGAESQEYTVEF